MQKKQGGKLKWVIIAVVVLGIVGIIGSGGEDEKVANIQSENENSRETNKAATTDDKKDKAKKADDEKDISNKDSKAADVNDSSEENDTGVEILAEYTLPDGIKWYTRHFMIIKNISSETLSVSTSSLAYKKDDTMVGAADSDFDALGAGCTSVIYEAFETDEKIHHYETEIKTAPNKYYESVIQDLSFKQNDVKDGAVFQVTNNGKDAAEFVEGYALFFLKGKLVSYESKYFTDDDSEIKPGKTISQQLTSHKKYDKVEFYLTGRK